MGGSAYGSDVYVAAVVTRRRNAHSETMTRLWCSEHLDGVVRVGSAVPEGAVGEVALVAQLPIEPFQAMPRWRWAVATLVAPGTAHFTDHQLLRRIARHVHTAPKLQVRCLTPGEFDAICQGREPIPATRGLWFARNPEAA